MSKLKDLVSKGVRLVYTDAETTGEGQAEVTPGTPARPRELTAEDLAVPEPGNSAPSAVAADVADFSSVYAEAGIDLPAHKYGVDKVAEMLAGKRLGSMSRELKAAAVMAALEAAEVPLRDVIQDAVRRDKALDAFEADKERELRELKAKNDTRASELNQQLEELIRKINAEVEALKGASEAAARAFAELRIRKSREEQRLYDVVAHFAEGAENPITTGQSALSPPPPKEPGRA